MSQPWLFSAAVPGPEALSVSELTAQIQELLADTFADVWVSGEISNLARPQSGHLYFSLKDESAQLAAVVWRSAAQRLRFDLADGMQVVCRGRIDVYPPRGSYQLIVTQVVPLGAGALELALRRLRERLAAEGLFDQSRKRPLPRFPRQLALVTSPSGAAVRDFLEVLGRRWRLTGVMVVPVRVQGAGAAQEMAQAICRLNQLQAPFDCIVLARGGGSVEDLWAFNEEVLVRAIAASRIPVVSAVGHEIDVTLADLAADVRALTPSEAAERVVPSAEEVLALLESYRQRMGGALRQRCASARTRLDQLAARPVFRRPYDHLHACMQRLDELAMRGARAVSRRCERARHVLEAAAGRLESLSPLAVLARGYSVTLRAADGSVVRDATTVRVGELLETQLARGRLASRVVAGADTGSQAEQT
jgi:exodeoxyribonuclease VII large subunit